MSNKKTLNKIQAHATSPILREVFKQLNINFDTYKVFLSDFCKGKLKRSENQERMYIEEIFTFPFYFEESNTVNFFFSEAQAKVETILKEANIEKENVLNIFYEENTDYNNECEQNIVIKAKVIESEESFKQRLQNLKKVDFLLDRYDIIYEAVLLEINKNKKIDNIKKDAISSIDKQIANLQQQKKDIQKQ